MTTLARTPVPQVRQQRVLELDGFRAFAILPVLFHHCYPNGGWIGAVGEAGWIGVDLFFVLSGYLITGILLDTIENPHYYRNFIVRRTLRIFPLYYCCLLLFYAATGLNTGSDWASMQKWGGPGWFFLYVGNLRAAWVNNFPPVFSFVPLWSLQVEEQFYLLYPLIVSRLSLRSLRRALIGAAIAAPLLRSCLLFFFPDTDMARYILMPCRMDALALGGLLAILVRSRDTSAPAPRPARWAAVAGGAILLAVPAFASFREKLSPFAGSIGFSLIDLACAALLAIVVLSPRSKLAAFLRLRPLVYTGQIAYGLYLLHAPASWLARRVISHLTAIDVAGHSAISVPITFAASFLAASLSWRFFESPILGLKDRFTYRGYDRRAKAASAER